MRLTATINTTNRQVDIRLNEIEQRLVDEDSSPEEFSVEEEEKNQESFIWILVSRVHLLDIVKIDLVSNIYAMQTFQDIICDLQKYFITFSGKYFVSDKVWRRWNNAKIFWVVYYIIIKMFIYFISICQVQSESDDWMLIFVHLKIHFTKHIF